MALAEPLHAAVLLPDFAFWASTAGAAWPLFVAAAVGAVVAAASAPGLVGLNAVEPLWSRLWLHWFLNELSLPSHGLRGGRLACSAAAGTNAPCSYVRGSPCSLTVTVAPGGSVV